VDATPSSLYKDHRFSLEIISHCVGLYHHIETMLQHCKRQEDALGPQAALHTVLAQRQLVDALLAECPESLRPRLLSVYSSMSSSVGFYCFDLDDPDSAMRYCDQGRAATQAQNLASKTDDVLVQVCAAERAATAYAIDGQRTAWRSSTKRRRALC
jgi:hypothetical protein